MQCSQEKTEAIILAIKEFASSINSASDGVGDMTALVNATSKLELKNIDHWERLIRDEFINYSDLFIQSKWRFWVKPINQLTWLDIISWDGHKREESLYALSGAAPNAFFLTLIIRRLNDWVPQVRKAARAVIPLVIKHSEPEHVVEALTVVLLSWDSWGRTEKADKQLILHLIDTEYLAVLFKSKLISSESGPMPSLFSQLGRTSILDKYLDEIADNAIQPYVRAKAFRSLFEGRMAWVQSQEWQWTDKAYGERKLIPVLAERKIEVQTPFLELLNRSAIDNSSIVRQISAEFIIRNIDSLGNQSRVLAENFAADKSSNVAERGQFILRKLDEKASDHGTKQS